MCKILFYWPLFFIIIIILRCLLKILKLQPNSFQNG